MAVIGFRFQNVSELPGFMRTSIETEQPRVAWFAIIAPLSCTFYNRGFEYGTTYKNSLRPVAFRRNGKAFCILGRAGSALIEWAENLANAQGGTVERVIGRYAQNDSDIPQDRCAN